MFLCWKTRQHTDACYERCSGIMCFPLWSSHTNTRARLQKRCTAGFFTRKPKVGTWTLTSDISRPNSSPSSARWNSLLWIQLEENGTGWAKGGGHRRFRSKITVTNVCTGSRLEKETMFQRRVRMMVKVNAFVLPEPIVSRVKWTFNSRLGTGDTLGSGTLKSCMFIFFFNLATIGLYLKCSQSYY